MRLLHQYDCFESGLAKSDESQIRGCFSLAESTIARRLVFLAVVTLEGWSKLSVLSTRNGVIRANALNLHA